MIASVRRDLENVADDLEHLLSTLPRLTREEKVDVAARIRAVAKSAKQIDDIIKADIKEWRKGKKGTVLGEIFKAVLSLVPTTRLDQKALEAEQPKIFAQYLRTSDQVRVTFEPR